MLLAAILAAAGAGDPEADLARSVLVFGERCATCHGESAAKGGLRLHTAAGWMAAVEPGSVEDSELLYRLTLPADDGEAMPPEGPRIGASEIEAIRAWVLAGADSDVLAGAMARAAREDAEADRLVRLREQLAAATGARIEPIGPTGGVTVSWSHAPGPPTADGLAALAPLAGNVVELRLSGVTFDPAILGFLPVMPRLHSARLERSPVDDAAVLALMAKAPALVELNLHTTKVSAASRDLRARYPQLRKLVLYGTPAAPPAANPFAAVLSRQPRRLLVGSAGARRVALLRETAIGHPELLWERRVDALHGMEWLGETSEGHGRVRIHVSPTNSIDVDTAQDHVVGSSETAPGGARATATSTQRLSTGHFIKRRTGPGPDEPHAVELDPATGEVLWTFRDVERFGPGPVLIHVLERTP